MKNGGNERGGFRDCVDPLTGLSDRQAFLMALEQYGAAEGLEILAADLDQLEQINRTRGYTYGDECIRQAAVLILSSLPGNAAVYRAVGGTFAVLAGEELQLEVLAQRLQEKLSKPEEGREWTLTSGWARFAPERDHHPEDTWIRAQQAMRERK